MGVKNTSIGQLLGFVAVGAVAHQAYKYYKANGVKKADRLAYDNKDSKLDQMLDDTFPASDPLPLRSGAGAN